MDHLAVDCHSHVFNAEDLPIDGFVRKLSPLPSLVTGALSLPLDRVLSWAAAGTEEADWLLARLRAIVTGVESFEEPSPPAELPSDEEVEDRLVELWPLPGPPSGQESTGSGDPLLDRIEQATPEQVRELEDWLLEWGDPEVVEAHRAEGTGGESITDWGIRADAIRRAVRRFMAVLRLITRPRAEVAAALAATYSAPKLFLPALVDFSYTTMDSPSTDVPEQIAIHSLLAKLSIVGGLPDAPNVRLHPMVGFCPYREVQTSELAGWDGSTGSASGYVPYADPSTAQDQDRYTPGIRYLAGRARALDVPVGPWESSRLRLSRNSRSLTLVRHAIELGGFAGVKLYPPSGFLPLGNVGQFGERKGATLDAALRALYAYCEAMQVPILTHAAHSIGFGEGFDDLAAPTGWERVLADYPDLRVNFGHFGHLYAPDQNAPEQDRWVLRFVALIDQYPHVYADLSNSRLVFDCHYREAYQKLLQQILGDDAGDPAVVTKRRRRVMFGSDYWLNTLSPEHRNSYDVFRDLFEKTFDADTTELFLGDNALRFLGIRDDDGQPDLANRNRQRLAAFYGPHEPPSWLRTDVAGAEATTREPARV